MKTQTGYTYIENGIPVISPERKPEDYNFVDCRFGGPVWNTDKYEAALKEWEKTLIKAYNADIGPGGFIVLFRMDHIPGCLEDEDHCTLVTPGQKVQHNEGTITKTL